ncbi:hypothetical protein EfmJHP35_14040 [Enterococcus faecium]|nr:hypothetical protein EfmJHP35_14040 [Enterococcus faecium]
MKPEGRKAVDIENSINEWLQSVPKNLFKSITFDCGKEFSMWNISIMSPTTDPGNHNKD